MSLIPRKYGEFTDILISSKEPDGYVNTVSSGTAYMKPITYALEHMNYAPITTVFNSMWTPNPDPNIYTSGISINIYTIPNTALLGYFEISLTSANWFCQTVGRPIQFSFYMPYNGDIDTTNTVIIDTVNYEKNNEGQKPLLGGGYWQGLYSGTIHINGRTQENGIDTTFIVGDTLKVYVYCRTLHNNATLLVPAGYPVGTIAPVA